MDGLSLDTFKKNATREKRVPSEDFPLLVSATDLDFVDPLEHALIGRRLDDSNSAVAVRVTLRPDKRENPSHDRPGVYYFATDPMALAKGDTTKLMDLLTRHPAHKLYTPPGGIVFVEGAIPVPGKPNAYTAKWLRALSRSYDDPTAQVFIGPASVTPLIVGRQSGKPFQAVRRYHVDDARLCGGAGQLLEAIEMALTEEFGPGNPGFVLRLHKCDPATGEITLHGTEPHEVRDRKKGDGWEKVPAAEAIDAYKGSPLWREVLDKPSYGHDAIELIPVTSIGFAPEVLKRAEMRGFGAEGRYQMRRDDPESLGIAISTVALYRNPEKLEHFVATLASPVRRDALHTIETLPSQCNRGAAPVPSAEPPRHDDLDDEIPF